MSSGLNVNGTTYLNGFTFLRSGINLQGSSYFGGNIIFENGFSSNGCVAFQANVDVNSGFYVRGPIGFEGNTQFYSGFAAQNSILNLANTSVIISTSNVYENTYSYSATFPGIRSNGAVFGLGALTDNLSFNTSMNGYILTDSDFNFSAFISGKALLIASGSNANCSMFFIGCGSIEAGRYYLMRDIYGHGSFLYRDNGVSLPVYVDENGILTRGNSSTALPIPNIGRLTTYTLYLG